MPNFGANYAKDEPYYSSQEYKDQVEASLESGNKLPLERILILVVEKLLREETLKNYLH